MLIDEILNKAKIELETCNRIIAEKEQRVSELKEKQVLIDKSQAICQSVAEETQKQLSVQLDNLVNLALETCFPGEYEFHLDFVTNRGKTEVVFELIDLKHNKVVDDILNSVGGGCSDLITLSLRLAMLSLSNVDKVLILDEPMKFLSKDLRGKAAELLKEISHKLDLEIIMITHIDEFKEIADKTFEIKKIDGVSQILSEV